MLPPLFPCNKDYQSIIFVHSLLSLKMLVVLIDAEHAHYLIKYMLFIKQ